MFLKVICDADIEILHFELKPEGGDKIIHRYFIPSRGTTRCRRVRAAPMDLRPWGGGLGNGGFW